MIEMYLLTILFSIYPSGYIIYMVMFNWVYIASRIELLSESRTLSANIVKTKVQ